MLSSLMHRSYLTERLIDDETLERFRLAMPVVDRLKRKYGRATLG